MNTKQHGSLSHWVKYCLLIPIGLIILVMIIATPLIIKARNEGDQLYEKYNSYTREVLAENFQLVPDPIKQEYQTIHPWKALKLIKIATETSEGGKLKRVDIVDSTLGLFMKMFTLLFQPNYNYNVPMFSVDIIFIGGTRIVAIEIIDPAGIKDSNITQHYQKMRAWKTEVDKLKPEPVTRWYKDIVTDFSIHTTVDRSRDDLLFEIYKAYLNIYIEMLKHAEPVSPDLSEEIQEGIEGYVATLIDKGGPAADVFKMLLGNERQKEYIRTVMFSVDQHKNK